MGEQSLTAWQGMSGRNRDLMTAKPVIPALIALGFGCYKFFDLGTSAEFWPYTYVVTVGGAASIVCIFVFSVAAARPSKRSVAAMLVGLSGFVPYLYSIYVIAVLGIYGIWLSINPVSIFSIAAGLLWIVLGYYMLRSFWLITELSVRRRH